MKNKNFDLILFSALFTGLFVISNVIAAKEVEILGFALMASFITYPLTFVISNIVNERLGLKDSRRVVFSGFITMLTIILLLSVTYYLPSTNVEVENAYKLLFDRNSIILMSSLLAFIVSQVVNFTIYSGVSLTRPVKYIFSAFIAVFIDSLLFHMMLNFSNITNSSIFSKVSSQTIFGILIVIAAFPLFYIFSIDNDKPQTKTKKTTTKKTSKK